MTTNDFPALPRLKYHRFTDPRSVRPELLLTKDGKKAWDDLDAAVRGYTALQEQHEADVRRSESELNAYAESVREAVLKGKSADSVAPLAPAYDPTARTIQAQAYVDAANAAAARLRDAILSTIPEVIAMTLEEVEKRERIAHDLIDQTAEAIRHYLSANRLRVFARALEAEPDRLPIINTADAHEVGNEVSKALEALHATLNWRADDNSTQIRIARKQANKTRSEEDFARLHDLMSESGKFYMEPTA